MAQAQQHFDHDGGNHQTRIWFDGNWSSVHKISETSIKNWFFKTKGQLKCMYTGHTQRNSCIGNPLNYWKDVIRLRKWVPFPILVDQTRLKLLWLTNGILVTYTTCSQEVLLVLNKSIRSIYEMLVFLACLWYGTWWKMNEKRKKNASQITAKMARYDAKLSTGSIFSCREESSDEDILDHCNKFI